MPTTMQHAPTIVSTAVAGRPGFRARSAARLGGDGAEHIFGCGAPSENGSDGVAAELDRGNHGGQIADDVDAIGFGRAWAARAACRRGDRRRVPIALVSSSGRGGSDANSRLLSVTAPSGMTWCVPVEIDERVVVVAEPDRHRVHASCRRLAVIVDQLSCDPGADRVVAAGQEPGVVGVQALHAGPGAAHAAVRPRARVIGRRRRRRARRRSGRARRRLVADRSPLRPRRHRPPPRAG